MIDQYTQQIKSGRDLDETEAQACLDAILAGDGDASSIADLLCALADKGEAVSEVAGFAQALLGKALALDLPREAIDLCGTGGVPFDRFNVSTAAAFVVSAGGVPVLKHGNRGSKKPNGSFDLLDALGCRFDFSADQIGAVFAKTRICFLFARTYHPVMKTVAEARRLASRRTIFNLAAPLCNPAHPHYQLVGTTDVHMGRRIAEVLRSLGRKRGLVVSGEPGIDDISISGKTQVIELCGEELGEFAVEPADFGIEPVPYDSIPGGDYEKNAETFMSLLQDGYPRSILDLVCVNAGAAFYCYGKVDNIYDGYVLSKKLFSEGSVFRQFEAYRAL